MRSRVRGDRAWALWFRPRIRAALIQGNWKLETAELFVLCEAVFLLYCRSLRRLNLLSLTLTVRGWSWGKLETGKKHQSYLISPSYHLSPY